uniref:Acid phosphatase n=1 Tax=Caenorhabditis japonica TaxID=281687 RepID=A0A8R1I1K4_CAEJA
MSEKYNKNDKISSVNVGTTIPQQALDYYSRTRPFEFADMNIRIRQLRNMFFLVTAVLFLGFLSAETDFPDDLQLVFLHAVWRHGDRSQDGHLNNFPVNTSDWIKGGGGYGQLSPEGMAQHFHLGKKLRDRYIKKFQFLHPFYDSQQVFIAISQQQKVYKI